LSRNSTRIKSLTIEVENLREELKPSRSYEWWRQFTPLWLDVTLNDNGSVTFTPNDYLSPSLRRPPTPLKYKSMISWAEGCPAFVGDVTGTAK
jgi:hypothetical protein